MILNRPEFISDCKFQPYKKMKPGASTSLRGSSLVRNAEACDASYTTSMHDESS